MNGTEQRVRHLAIASAEKRLADLELLVTAIDSGTADSFKAVQAGFEAVNTWQRDLAASHNTVLDAQSARIDALVAENQRHLAAWEARTLWQRLRWLVIGR